MQHCDDEVADVFADMHVGRRGKASPIRSGLCMLRTCQVLIYLRDNDSARRHHTAADVKAGQREVFVECRCLVFAHLRRVSGSEVDSSLLQEELAEQPEAGCACSHKQSQEQLAGLRSDLQDLRAEVAALTRTLQARQRPCLCTPCWLQANWQCHPGSAQQHCR